MLNPTSAAESGPFRTARSIARACGLVVLLNLTVGCGRHAQTASAQAIGARAATDAGGTHALDAGSAGQLSSGAETSTAGVSASSAVDGVGRPGGSRGAAGSGGADDGTHGAAGDRANPPSGSVGAAMQSARSRDVPALDETLVANETADANALERLTHWADLPRFTQRKYQQQSSHDRGQPHPDEDALFPMLAYGNRDLDNFICKSADAQLGSSRLLTYRFDQDSCADSYVHGVVLARYEGSGSLLRLWMTATSLVSNNAFADELFRVYVDDNPRPLIQLPLEQVRSGSGGEIFATPFGAGSRSFIAWYYPVVFTSKLIIAIDRLSSDYYFQSDVALDTEPQNRLAPAQRLAQRAAAAAQLTAASPVPPQVGSLHVEQLTLASAEQRAVRIAGPATIQEIRLRVAKSQLAKLAGVRLSTRWDDAKDPALDLPLLDLFAAGRSVVARSNLALAAFSDGDDQLISLRLPMPFRKSAAWLLENGGSDPVEFQLEWFGASGVPGADFGYLHVQRSEAMLPATQVERSVAQASGRGRYIGLCADLAGHQDNALGLGSAPLNFLEGDFRAKVDGQLALDGTGTEDYPDNAFYFRDSPRATPFAQNWGLVSDVSLRPPGQVSFCRWQVLGNEVDFESSFNATFEMSQHDAPTSNCTEPWRFCTFNNGRGVYPRCRACMRSMSCAAIAPTRLTSIS